MAALISPYTEDGPAQYLIDALQDPYNPARCSGSLLAAFQPFVESYIPTTSEELRRQSTLYQTLYQFLVVKRPLGQLKQWMERFSTCADCNRSDDHYGDSTNAARSQFMHEKWDFMKPQVSADYQRACSTVARMDKAAMYPVAPCAFVTGAMRIIELALRRRTNLNKSIILGTSNLWPTNIPSLMPFGPDQLTESILQWYTVYPEPPLIQFFAMIVQLTRSILYPSISKHGFFSMTVNSMKQYLDVALDILDGVIHVDSKAASSFLQMFDYMVLTYANVLGNTLDVLPHTNLLLFNGCEVKAMQMFSLLVATLPKLKAAPAYRRSIGQSVLDRFDDRIGDFLLFSSKMYRGLHMDKYSPPVPDMLIAQSIVLTDMFTYFGSHDGFEAELGLSILWINALLYGCSAKVYGCTQYFENVGMELKFCKGCLGVYYCGEECQRKEWNDPEYPHRRICPILSKIAAAQRVNLEKKNANLKPSSDVIKIALDAASPGTDLLVVREIRKIIRMGKLSPEETAILKGWGRRIYGLHKIETKWQPGFEDYNAIVRRLSFPSGRSGYKANFAYMTKSPSEVTQREKALLVSSPEHGDADYVAGPSHA